MNASNQPVYKEGFLMVTVQADLTPAEVINTETDKPRGFGYA